MHIVAYDVLPEEAKHIRTVVFMDEQHFEIEFDDLDARCTHLVAFEGDTAIATCRYYFDDAENSHLIGRIAVLKPYRGKGLGALLVNDAAQRIRAAGGKRLTLSAQVQAQGFYERLGFAAYGDTYLDEHCAHIHMTKALEGRL